MKLYNTLTRKIEGFTAINPPRVGMYSCGPTVYDYQHIGHMRRYVGDDILIRVLRANGYKVEHVMNITDVGHLVSDSDTGEDKMEKGAKKFGKSVWELAKMFEEQFWNSTDDLNIQRPDKVMHATDYIEEQIRLVKVLEDKGYTYPTEDGIYFDTSKFPDYFALSRQNPKELKKGARVDFIEGKRNISDFALWKFSPSEVDVTHSTHSVRSGLPKRQMEWESPWGRGFPGWHIECSAMSMKVLGPHFDIHTGGIDHIAIHHTNEIAQSECATGQKFVNFWVHHNFLVVENTKMSKSLGNFFTVQDVIAKGYDPLSLRYLYLQTHYRQEMNFTWEALEAAQNSLQKLRAYALPSSQPPLVKPFGPELKVEGQATSLQSGPNLVWMERFMEALNDDLNTAKALSYAWEMARDENLLSGEKKATLLEMDKILGLGLNQERIKDKGLTINDLPADVHELIKEREAFRQAGDWAAADEVRKKIENLGFNVQDTKEGPKISKL